MIFNKVVLITGATRGIGKSIALLLAKRGAVVGINGTNIANVENIVQEIINNGGKAIGLPGNVTINSEMENNLKVLIDKYKKIDILINCAGIVKDRTIKNMTIDEWKKVIDVNLNGVFNITKPAVKQMMEQGSGGDIVNFTSLAGLEGSFGQVNYSTAKAGILGLTWTLSKELKKYGIRVNAISPAALTDMTIPIIEREKKLAEKNNKCISDYWNIGTSEDVAEFVLNLLINRDKNISGNIFSVNGNKIGYWEKPKHHVFESNSMKDDDFFYLTKLRGGI